MNLSFAFRTGEQGQIGVPPAPRTLSMSTQMTDVSGTPVSI